MINQRGGVMTMRLQPADLGELRVQMSIVRGVVTAQFQAATAEAGTLLERSLSTLRTALESHGLTVERLTVTGPQTSGSASLREHTSQEQTNQQQRDHADAGEGQSRGRHDAEPQRFASFFNEVFEFPTQGGEAA